MSKLSCGYELLNYPGGAASPPSISTKNSSTWTHCGPFLNIGDLPSSYHSWAASTIDGSLTPLLAPLLEFVHQYLAQAQLQHYWLTIRATRTKHDFDRPRWHTDKSFFATTSASRQDWKLVATLLGPGTLLVEDGASARSIQQDVKESVRLASAEHECRQVRCLGCAAMQDEVRDKLAEGFRDFSVGQVNQRQCARLWLGSDEGAVHSEPPCYGDRVFVNIVPGHEEDLRKMLSQWGMCFPRAWSIGVPING